MEFLRPFTLSAALAATMASAAPTVSPPPEAQVTVMSPAFSAAGMIPDQFTCKGEDTNPPLKFYSIPGGAKSLVLVVDDPDAPGGVFTHWMLWNINPKIQQIAPKSVPAGSVQGTNDVGKIGYGGPCPPSGTHRYFFRIYVLDRTLDLANGAKRPALEKAMTGHILARGELMAQFGH